REAAYRSPHIVEIHAAVENMAPLYEWCNAVVSNAGSTCWEWLRYDLPAAIAITADNQQFIAKELIKNQRAIDLGHGISLEKKALLYQLGKLLDSCEREISQEQRKYIDGYGASRVCAALDMPLSITILTDESSWFNAYTQSLTTSIEEMGHDVRLTSNKCEIESGDILFLLSVWEVVPEQLLALNAHNLIVHESDLPKGRGWSPVSWQILNGAEEIPLCLIEAEKRVDAGVVYIRSTFNLEGTELIEDIRELQANATIKLCLAFMQDFPHILREANPQTGEATYYKRRRPECSGIDPTTAIADCFDLFRIADNEKYPVFFEYRGKKYKLAITHMRGTNE
ncbi:hypothetical protein N9018_03865, partial [Rhodopirellula sp.]|nr:hypothetical protein [Rhodopirellula sp.]